MEIYHVLSRGVDRRNIFLDDHDRFRFIHDLFEFNDTKPANNVAYLLRKSNDIVSRYKRDLLVEILAFCLMPNHYHLLLTPLTENGVSFFMRKLNIGYAKYFNEKNRRQGTLFEGRYKSIVIKKEAHFYHLPHYLHLNPLDLILPQWRERTLEAKEYKKAMTFLETYRWSSFLDYCGKENFPSITQRDLVLDAFGGKDRYQQSLQDWLGKPSTETRKLTTYDVVNWD